MPATNKKRLGGRATARYVNLTKLLDSTYVRVVSRAYVSNYSARLSRRKSRREPVSVELFKTFLERRTRLLGSLWRSAGVSRWRPPIFNFRQFVL
jgi:hypothetical protein